MTIALYERIWMWGATGLIVMFLGAIFVTAIAQAVEPPGHLETVDPTTILSHPEFGKPQIVTNADGSVVVPIVAGMFSFTPDPIEVPAQRPRHVPADQPRRDPRLPGGRHQRQRDGDPGLRHPVHRDLRHAGRVHDRLQRVSAGPCTTPWSAN